MWENQGKSGQIKRFIQGKHWCQGLASMLIQYESYEGNDQNNLEYAERVWEQVI